MIFKHICFHFYLLFLATLRKNTIQHLSAQFLKEHSTFSIVLEKINTESDTYYFSISAPLGGTNDELINNFKEMDKFKRLLQPFFLIGLSSEGAKLHKNLSLITLLKARRYNQTVGKDIAAREHEHHLAMLAKRNLTGIL